MQMHCFQVRTNGIKHIVKPKYVGSSLQKSIDTNIGQLNFKQKQPSASAKIVLLRKKEGHDHIKTAFAWKYKC